MAKSGQRIVIRMKSSESAHSYWTRKSKRNSPDRLEFKKYDPTVRKHVPYKEAKS